MGHHHRMGLHTPPPKRPASARTPPSRAKTVPYMKASVHNLPRRDRLVRARSGRPSMADHCGPALESRAACALALVRCAAARVRSRVGRHPHDPCGHPAREEHALPARMQRTSCASRPVRGTAAHRMQRGSRAGGQGGGRAGKLTLIICRACPNCPWTPTSCRSTRSAPPLLSAWSDLRRDPNSTRLSRVRNALQIR